MKYNRVALFALIAVSGVNMHIVCMENKEDDLKIGSMQYNLALSNEKEDDSVNEEVIKLEVQKHFNRVGIEADSKFIENEVKTRIALKKMSSYKGDKFDFSSESKKSINRKEFLSTVFRQLAHAAISEEDALKGVENLLSEEDNKLSKLPTALAKIEFLIALKQEVIDVHWSLDYDTRVKIQKFVCEDVAPLIIKRLEFVFDCLEKDDNKTVSEVGAIFMLLLTTQPKDKIYHYGSIFKVYSNYGLIERLAGEENKYGYDTFQMRPLFTWYFDNVKDLSDDYCTELVQFLTNENCERTPQSHAKQLKKAFSVASKNNGEIIFNVIYEQAFNGLYSDRYSDIFTELFSCFPKMHEKFYNELVFRTTPRKSSPTWSDIRLIIGIVCNNFPHTIGQLNNFPFSQIKEDEIKKFVLAGYLSRLHKINSKKQQIGYEPAQIILQFLGSHKSNVKDDAFTSSLKKLPFKKANNNN